MVYLEKTKILYDWLAFSSSDDSYDSIKWFLFGNKDVPFVEQVGSNRFYQYHATYGHIQIHYTIDDDKKNQGCFVEMSGQGCREYEGLGRLPLDNLIENVAHRGYNVSRLDVALDDMDSKHPLIRLEDVAEQALAKCFTSRLQRFKVDYSCKQSMQAMGLSVQHGSRCSDFYLRIYDKRAERECFDTMQHWVRCEIQLRGDLATNFTRTVGSIGQKFRSALSNYVTYREQNTADTNKRRWAVSEWWQRLLDGAKRISLASKCLVDYNKSKLDDFVYKRCARAILAVLACDGLDVFLPSVVSCIDRGFLPSKYTSIIAQQTGQHPDRILYDGYRNFLYRIGFFHNYVLD